MRKSFSICLASAFFLFFSCSYSEQDGGFNKRPIDDTMVTRIPSESPHLFKSIQWEADRLNLDSILSGFDSLQIRIWLGGKLRDSKSSIDDRQILIIKYNPSPEVILMTNTWKLGIDSGALVKSNRRELIPSCGWSCFTDSLNLFNIDHLPDESIVANAILDSQQQIVFFEIAKHKFYKFVSFTAPRKNVRRSKEYATVSSFLGFLERQLGFEIISDEI
jgi:hypothetical protein